MLKKIFSICILTSASLVVTGCVERELTINTRPAGAIVELNDEEIGVSPVTVNFEWYGCYKVRISKEGYETLVTNTQLERPTHDRFPFDIFENIFNPDRLDSYCWEFQLQEYQKPDRDVLIDRAQLAKEKISLEMEEAQKKAATLKVTE